MNTASVRQSSRRSIGLWAVAFLCLNAAACFRTLDVSKIKCVNESNCPSDYSCFRTTGEYGTCVPRTDGSTGEVSMSPGTGGQGGLGGIDSGGYDGGPIDGLRGSGGTTTIGDGPGGASGPIDANLGGTGGTGGTGGIMPPDAPIATGGTGGIMPPDAPSATGGTTSKDAPGATGGTTSVLDAPLAADGTDAPAGLATGTSCTTDGQCSSSHCIDGVCCATTCAGCNACSNALTGKDNGICAPVLSGQAAHNACTDETATNQCGNDGTCDGKGACRKVGTSHTCKVASCSSDGKTFTPTTTCDGNGACTIVTSQDCGGFQCVTAGCPKTCTVNSDCGTGSYCDTSTGKCAATKSPGAPATNGYECTSGVVADGVCCDKACTGCNACTSALNGQASTTTGQCLPVVANKSAPHSACTANPPCGLDGTCDGNGACHYPTGGTSCANPSCVGSTLTTSACDSTHACAQTPKACDNSLTCASATSCKSSCSADADCILGYYCASGTCTIKKTSGTCSSANQCSTGFCADGYCCDGQCGGTCQSCSSTPGTCKAVTTPRTSCGGSGTCGTMKCDGTGPGCVYPGSETACPNQCNSDWTAVMSSTCNGSGTCGTGSPSNCPSSQYCSTSTNQCTGKITNTTTSCSRDIQCSTGKCCSTCVNANNDNSNCGACGNKCVPNQTCQTGSCACTGYTFPAVCGSTCGSWSFESGPSTTEGWAAMLSPQVTGSNGAINAGISSTRPAGYPGTGSYSLVAPVIVDNTTKLAASVGVQFCQAGKTTSLGGYNVTGYVYFSGPALPAYHGFFVDTWGPTASEASNSMIFFNSVVTNQWIPFQASLSFGFQYDHLALRISPNGSWSGTMYVDDVAVTGL